MKVFQYENFNSTENIGRCYVRPTSFNTPKKVADARQMIIFTDYTLLISSGLARYHASANYQCIGSQHASIEVRFGDYYGLTYNGIFKGLKCVLLLLYSIFMNTLDSTPAKEMGLIEMSGKIHADVMNVVFIIAFIDNGKNNLSLDESFCTLDNVRFSISKI